MTMQFSAQGGGYCRQYSLADTRIIPHNSGYREHGPTQPDLPGTQQ